MKIKLGSKKTISQLVATVLLIVITIALAAMIMLWMRGFISEQLEKFGRPVEDVCGDVTFDASITSAGDVLDISNTGNVAIGEIKLKIITGGDAEVKSTAITVDAGQARSFPLSSEISDAIIGADSVIVIPSLYGTVRGGGRNKNFVCPDEYGKKIYLNQ